MESEPRPSALTVAARIVSHTPNLEFAMLPTLFLKFIHVLFILGLLGTTLYIVYAIHQPLFPLRRFLLITLFLAIMSLITGTFLVIPRHFTFHTPWIQAAYLLLIVFFLGIAVLLFTARRPMHRLKIWIYRATGLILITILLFIIHDAVTKTTLLTIS